MSEDNKTRRDAIMRKVQALLQKTVDNGCTEAEAVQAATLAAKLMEEHDLTYTDIEGEVRRDAYGARRRPLNGSVQRRSRHEVQDVAYMIGKFWDCECWCSIRLETVELVFFGERTDTENAHHMVDLIRFAMEAEFKAYMRSDDRDDGVAVRTLRTSFMRGMADRLNERLKAIKAARTKASTTGTQLVVVRNQVVTQKFAEYCRANGMRMKTRRAGSTVGNAGAYMSGQAAGGRVDLGGGKINSSSLRIGGR